jgi:hypothetical protein
MDIAAINRAPRRKAQVFHSSSDACLEHRGMILRPDTWQPDNRGIHEQKKRQEDARQSIEPAN